MQSDTLYRRRVARSATKTSGRKRRRVEGEDHSPTDTYNDKFIFDAMPEEYYTRGLDNVALLNDGKDFVTDTVRINSCLARGQYSDKMKSSAARYIA